MRHRRVHRRPSSRASPVVGVAEVLPHAGDARDGQREDREQGERRLQFLIKMPPTSRLTELIRRRPEYGSVRSIVSDPRRRRARPRHDRRPACARTPLLSSRTLGARLKCELFQRTGSFKARGALNKISSLSDEEKRRGVIAISAGNHAQAVAFAAARSGIDALVVMWQGASEQKIEATRGYGATVDLEASGPARRVRAARRR